MDCALKFMKERNLRSMNNRATIMQDRRFGFGFVLSRAGGRNGAVTRMCAAATCSALAAGCCG